MQSCWLKRDAQDALNIWIIGHSEKFIRAARLAFPECVIRVISWRRGLDLDDTGPSPDLLIVCGYDYRTYFCSEARYLDRNVIRPANWIASIAASTLPVIYITTADGKSLKTWSRYRFAKTRLACELKKRAVNVRVIGFPTILDEQGNVDVHGGIVTRWLFRLAIWLRLAKSVSFSRLPAALAETVSAATVPWEVSELDARLLCVPRTNFADRVLRMLCG
jgi:hypothetical protein